MIDAWLGNPWLLWGSLGITGIIGVVLAVMFSGPLINLYASLPNWLKAAIAGVGAAFAWGLFQRKRGGDAVREANRREAERVTRQLNRERDAKDAEVNSLSKEELKRRAQRWSDK